MASSIFPSRRISARPCAGLDIAPDRVNLALLRRCGQRTQLLRLDQRFSARPLCRDGHVVDFDALVLICRSLLDKPVYQGATLALALPAATLTGRRLILPAGSSEVQRLAQVRADMAATKLLQH